MISCCELLRLQICMCAWCAALLACPPVQASFCPLGVDCAIGFCVGGATASGDVLVKKLGSRRVNHLFTHLRKIAQHPLLVRHRFTDKQVQAMARLAFSK